ncbi:MAG: vWA domain-containing protein [Planctomycetota bacterium]
MVRFFQWLIGVEPAQHVEGGDWRLSLLGWPGGDKALMILVGLALVAGLFWWLYRREGGQITRKARYLLFTLRLLLLAIVVFILLEPAIKFSKVEQRPSQLLVLIDTSPSMGMSDAWVDPDRARAAAQAAGLEDTSMLSETARLALAQGVLRQGLLNQLTADGERVLHVHTFDERLSRSELNPPTRSAADEETSQGESENNAPNPAATDDAVADMLALSGRSTGLGESLQQVLQAYRGVSLAGVVVITDGQNSTPNSLPVMKAAAQAQQDGVPVYPVGMGTVLGPRNATVSQLEANDIVFIRDTTQLTATIHSRGLEGEPARVFLEQLIESDEEGEEDVWGPVPLPPGEDGLPRFVEPVNVELVGHGLAQYVSFDFMSNDEQTVIFRARLEEVEGEIDPLDNTAIKQVNVVPDKTRVLFIAGYSFPEVQFLRNALLRDPSVEVSTWLQEAARVNARDEHNWQQPASPGLALNRLPRTLEELDQYDCIVLYDPDPRGWAVNFSDLLVEFVANRGGGLVYICGERNTQDLFNQQGSPAVSFLNLLPVTREPGLFPSAVQVSLTMREPWKLQITETGMRDEVFAFNGDPVTNRKILQSLPGLMWHFTVTREKPGATVLARHGHNGMTNRYGEQEVLMATHLVGPGRVLYIGFDSTYRWRFVDEQLFDGFWARVIDRAGLMKQLGGQHPYRISTDKAVYEPGEEVTLTARFTDANQRDAGLSTLYAEVQTGEGQPMQLELAPGSDDNTFSTTFVVDRAGDFLVRVWPGDAATQRSSKPNTHSFRAEVPDHEARNPTLDADLIQRVANLTGGQAFTLDTVDGLPDAITIGLVDDEQINVQPVWNAPILIILFLLFIIAEWVIRKRCRLV